MGMPVTLEVAEQAATRQSLDEVFGYLQYVDEKFSTYKNTSEISAINRGEVDIQNAGKDMQEIFALAEETRLETNGYFDIRHNGMIDPSGLVKGWSIQNAAELFRRKGYRNYYVEAGGDAEVAGKNQRSLMWQVGIRDPFNSEQIVKVLSLSNCGVATSGTYIRGQHIYDPNSNESSVQEIVSLTVVGPNVFEADRYATAAFAMGREGIGFIERLEDFEGYMIDENRVATMTSGFERYVVE